MARPAKRTAKAEPDVSRETSGPEAPAPKPRKALPYPRGLGTGGRLLWREVTIAHDVDIVQRVTLEEACRAKDRLDDFDRIIQGEGVRGKSVLDLMHFRIPHAFEPGDDEVVVKVEFDDVVTKANQTANLMKQLLAALRLPDASGARPQQRGGARGAYVSGGADSGGNGNGTGGGSTLGNLRSITGGQA